MKNGRSFELAKLTGYRQSETASGKPRPTLLRIAINSGFTSVIGRFSDGLEVLLKYIAICVPMPTKVSSFPFRAKTEKIVLWLDNI